MIETLARFLKIKILSKINIVTLLEEQKSHSIHASKKVIQKGTHQQVYIV